MKAVSIILQGLSLGIIGFALLPGLLAAWTAGAQRVEGKAGPQAKTGVYCSHCGAFEERQQANFCAACGKALKGQKGE